MKEEEDLKQTDGKMSEKCLWQCSGGEDCDSDQLYCRLQIKSIIPNSKIHCHQNIRVGFFEQHYCGKNY